MAESVLLVTQPRSSRGTHEARRMRKQGAGSSGGRER